MNEMIIDAHAHLGIQDSSFDQSFESYCSWIQGTGISAVAAFAPVAEIYDRHDAHFRDNHAWITRRTRANRYLLDIGSPSLRVIPYFFIWNDFATDQLTRRHKGIKWHRHACEPVYHYDSDHCAQAIRIITEKRMPVVLEEELGNTVRFIRDLAPKARVIIPHLGGLNGGYTAVARAGLWENPNVWADTALASPREIDHYIRTYGHDRLMFGSDFPFGDPASELSKVRGLTLGPEAEQAVLAGNLTALLAQSNP